MLRLSFDQDVHMPMCSVVSLDLDFRRVTVNEVKLSSCGTVAVINVLVSELQLYSN